MTWKDMYVEIYHTHAGADDSVSVANRRWLDDQAKPAGLVLHTSWYEVDERAEHQRPVFIAVDSGFWYVRCDVYKNEGAAESLMDTLPRADAAACRALLEALEAISAGSDPVISEDYYFDVTCAREAEALSAWLDDILAGRWCFSGRRVFACPDHIYAALNAADVEAKAEAKRALEEAIQPLLGNDIDFADDFTYVVAETLRVWRVVRSTLAEVLDVAPVSLIEDPLGRDDAVENAYNHWLYLLTKRMGLLTATSRRYDLLRYSDADLERTAFLLDGTSKDPWLPDDWKALGLYGGGQ